MPASEVDTNLLFGVLGLQVGLIEQADLLDAFQRWSRDRSGSLAQVLVDRGTLTTEDRATLENLVRRHVEKNGGNLERSLAAVAPSPAWCRASARSASRLSTPLWLCYPISRAVLPA